MSPPSRIAPRELSEAWMDWRGEWTHIASKRATLESIIATIMSKAGEAFMQKRDAEADILRRLAGEFEKEEKIASTKLHEFISGKIPEPPMWEGETL